MTTKKGTFMCNNCTKVECRNGYPKGIPAYCMATTFHDIVEKTKKEYSRPDIVDIYKASGKVVGAGYGRWPRIQEAIEFAKELKLTRVGFASCVALIQELGMVTELFTGAGFETISAACQIGRVPPKERGVILDSDDTRGLFCNPIAQAEILNQQGSQLNFMLGLCLGHDIMFTKYSRAPVSTLIVKDRVTGNNPAAALYSSFHRRPLWKQYCNKDVD
ncbi:MAG: DUF1847 domain-containing protein [Dehalococcoidales bacterium]|nr:DUF1847 domain-containing protein [Dehalococcoidales bacterium]